MATLRFAAPLLAVLAFCSATLAADRDPVAGARALLQKGNVDEALEACNELDKEPTLLFPVALLRSRCFEAQGHVPLAIEVLTAALEKSTEKASLLARLAELQLATGEFAAAEKSVEEALATAEEHPHARLVQARLLAATGRIPAAAEGFRWFVKYYNRAQPTDAETILLVAEGSIEFARWHSNSQIFDFVLNTLCPDALEADKNCWQAHYLGGALLLEKFNRAQAMPEFKKALAINPRAAEVHTALAEAALQDMALADAQKHVARALEINPHLIPALLVKADLELHDGDLRAAREVAEEALSGNPRHEPALARIAVCNLLEDGPPPAAELDNLFDNLDSIGEAALSNPSRFTKLAAELAGWNPHPGVFLAEVAVALEARKRFDLAERFYRQSIASLPQLPRPKAELGMLYMRVGRSEEATKLLDQAFEADPYHVRVSNMRKVLKLLDGYESIATDHFVVRVDGQADKILGRYIADFLEEEYPALVAEFGYEPETRTQFEVFHKAKGLSAHQWFSARMVGLPWLQTIGASTGMIVALASPTASDKPYNWARVVRHEFVHILTLQKTEFNIPHWFTEALAVRSERTPRPENWNHLLLERVPKGEVMNLDNINLGFIRPRGPDDWTMAYCQSRLYAQYMIDKFGEKTLAELLAAYQKNLSTDQAIPRVFGVDKATFEKGYRAYLDDIVAGLKRLPAEPPLTLAQAEKAHRAAPEDPQPAARYAFELLRINRRKDARKLAEAALAKNKVEPLAALVMAFLELRSEDIPAAIKHLEPALDRKQPHPLVLDKLAELKLKQGELSSAAELYELGLTFDPDRVAWMKGLAIALLKDQQTDRLKPVLERLALVDGDDPAVRQKLAKMALAEKDYEGAIRFGRMALEVDVLDLETHRTLAQAYAALDRHEPATREWSVALELKPDDPQLIVDLARSEAAAGKKDAALKRLEELEKKDSSFEPAKALLRELQ